MSETDQSTIRYDRDADGIVVLTLDDPHGKRQHDERRYVASMTAVVDRLYAEKDDITGVVVTSAKKTFFAGGDLVALVQATTDDAADIFAMIEQVKADLRRLETLGRPVVAAINGSALGGGLEIALAAHHRIAVDDGSIEIGCPEVTLGLLPGAGGVTRTVRMFGLQDALMNVLLQGQRRKPAQALEVGLVDELVDDVDALLPTAKKWVLEHRDDEEAASQPWDRPGFRIPGGTPSTPKLAQFLPAFPANLRKQLKGAPYPAPRAIMSAAIEGSQVDFETATRIESRYFVDLVTGPISKNMIQAFFFDLQAINGGKSRPDGVPAYTARKVGVLGAGMMGAGIAYECARAGMDVVLKDVSTEAAEKGKAYSVKLLDKQVERGRSTVDKRDEVLARITADRQGDRPGRLRPGDRGGLREPGAQAPGVRRDRGRGGAGRAAVLQHVDTPDHRTGHRREAPGRLHRAALLLAGRADAPGRDHRRQADVRRGVGQGVRRGPPDPQDPDRGQRQPRASSPHASSGRSSSRASRCSARASTR